MRKQLKFELHSIHLLSLGGGGGGVRSLKIKAIRQPLTEEGTELG